MKFNSLVKSLIYKNFSLRAEKLKILKLDKNCNQADIKKAYTKLVKEVHPDVNKEKNSSEKFKQITDAYQYLLNNPNSDNRTSKKDQAYQNKKQQYYSDEFCEFSDEEDYEDYQNMHFEEYFFGDFEINFNNFFKRQKQRIKKEKRPQNSSKIDLNLNLTLKESINGGVKEIKFQRNEICNCVSSDEKKCSKCKGKGFQIYKEASQRVELHCLSCGGTGTKRKRCNICKNSRIKKEWVKEYIQIPKNIAQNDVLQVKNIGNYIKKSKNKGYHQDLWIKIKIIPDKNFKKQGNLYLSKTNITPWQAVLGESFLIETLTGQMKIKLKNPIQNDQTYEFTEKIDKKSKINYKTKFNIQIPTNISFKQKQLYQKLMDLDQKYHEQNT